MISSSRVTSAAPPVQSVLDVADLTTRFATQDGEVLAADHLSFRLAPGESLGIVGESGSGKTQAVLAIMGLLARNGRTEGSARYRGQELLGLRSSKLNEVRGEKVAMIFQDPMTSLNPYLSVGRQLREVLVEHRGLSRRAAWDRAALMLGRVGITDASARMRLYPHEFSGGMRQRVMIAMALLCEPDLLIADEPTTALDVTVQAQILELLKQLRAEFGMAMVLITHDLGVVAGACDRVMVLYAGRIMELAPVDELFAGPQHPYSRGLLASTPRLDAPTGGELSAIPGQPPNLQAVPEGCVYATRCPFVFDRCRTERPGLRETAPGHSKSCHLEALP